MVLAGQEDTSAAGGGCPGSSMEIDQEVPFPADYGLDEELLDADGDDASEADSLEDGSDSGGPLGDGDLLGFTEDEQLELGHEMEVAGLSAEQQACMLEILQVSVGNTPVSYKTSCTM